MKLNKIPLIAFITLLVILTAPVFAGDGEWTLNAQKNPLKDGVLYRFTATVDSVDTLTSNIFSFTEYDDGALSTYPIYYSRKLTSANSKPRITALWMGSIDYDNWVVIDTVGVVTDSLETYEMNTLDLNSKKAPFNKIIIYGTEANDPDTEVDYSIYLPRRDSHE